MPDDYGQMTPDELLQAAMGAGLYPQRMQQLQQRMGMGNSLMDTPSAQGRNVGQTYVASSPLEHVSNAIRRLIGAKMAGDSMQGQQDLTTQLGKQRQQYMQGLGTAMNGGTGGTLGQEGGGMARPADPAQGNQMLMGAFASGDPGLEKMASGVLSERNQERQLHVLENTLRHQQVMEGQGQERLGQGDERVAAMTRALELRGVRWNPNTSQFENISGLAHPPRGGGAPMPGPTTAPTGIPGEPAQKPLGKWQSNDLQHMVNDFNPSSHTSGEFGANQKRVNAARRVLALAVDDNGNARDLNPQQMPELAQSVAALIGGSSTAQAQVEHLMPKTFSKDAAGILQYLTAEPHGAGQQAFVQNFVDTAKREAAVAQQGIEQVRGQLGTKYQRLIRSNPLEVKAALKPFGWDLGPDGMPVQAQAAASPAAPPSNDAAALRKKYGL